MTFFYYAEAYVNFNDLVVDLFKQYKVRIWMSAVNPASVVNPAGLMQVPPPSAIGPGAIIHSSGTNTSLSVGPGFGNNAYRGNEQYGKCDIESLSFYRTYSILGRGRGNVAQGNYDENYYAFSHQLPTYPTQQTYQMPQWGHAQMTADMYGRFGFPNVTAGGSPMNYGAWYPPTTYSASPAFNNASSGVSYRGGYPATTGAGSAYGQYTTSGLSAPATYSTAPAYSMYATSGAGNFSGHGTTSTSYGNGFTATSGAATSATYDPALLTAMANMSFGNK